MNYIELGGRLWLHYVYIDTCDYHADSLFNRHKIPVKLTAEYGKEGVQYIIIFCKIRKKYRTEFRKALDEAVNKIELLGHSDYTGFCEDFLGNYKSAMEGPF